MSRAIVVVCQVDRFVGHGLITFRLVWLDVINTIGICKGLVKKYRGGGGGPEQRGGGSSVFEPLVRGGSCNF